MPSPFPGMDPYLEPLWLDVHATLVAETKRSLNRLLPKGLVARIEERIAIESGEESFQRVRPDVLVFSPSTTDPTETCGGIAIEAPYKLVVDLDPIIERFIQILDEAGQLVTVVEFISPTNKRQPGLDEYRAKRASLVSGGVHVVEVDFTRSGNWRALMRPALCPPEAITEYRVVIWTAGRNPAIYLYPIPLRGPLPEIQIPLRPSDDAMWFALQPLMDSLYDDGRYSETVDYTLPLDPTLPDEDAAWITALLGNRKGATGA